MIPSGTRGQPRPPYSVSAEQSLEQFGSTVDGLNTVEAAARLRSQGPNRLPAPPSQPALVRFLLQFHNTLIYVLLGSATITAMLRHWVDTLVILAVVLVNAILGFIQEGRAEKALVAVRRMLAPVAAVLREGVRYAVDAEELVPGDLVLLEAGDRVPADLRLIQSHGLMIQESLLTGESVPVEKTIEAVASGATLADRNCMAFSGTLVTAGQGRGLVVATGTDSEIGRISGLISQVEPLATPLVTQMSRFALWLTVFILAVAMLILAFGYFIQGHPFGELFMAVVGLSVAAIPEGLPAVLTITLAIGVQAMARRNAIIRRLPAIETIGAVSVICTDKTGTLTCNEMMVTHLFAADLTLVVTGSGYSPEGGFLQDDRPLPADELSRLAEIGRCAALCNDAQLQETEAQWLVNGDPMEGALLALARKLGVHEQEERKIRPRTDAIPFDARYRLMATLHHDHEGHAAIYVKGAPEAVLDHCRWQKDGEGNLVPVNTAYWRARYEEIAARGRRVLALAMRSTAPERTLLEFSDLEGTLILLGLVGLEDPPRPEAIEAVAQCLRAGISVKMITGDHAGTAAAIAAEVGLAHPGPVLTGQELDRMGDEDLARQIRAIDIFARTSPEHKLRLVMALQANGLTVAMTGDGVNDAPALKRADAGIAMGRKGSEAAKEASDLVLADDNFASIVAAVREGRTVYENLKKVIGWTLPTNSGEALTIIVAVLFGVTLPVTPVQILWVNLVTAITLGLALAFEPTSRHTMNRPPRSRSEPLLSGVLIWHMVLVSILFLAGVYGIFTYALARGHSLELARTLAVNTLVVMEIFHLFFMRNFNSTRLSWKEITGTPAVWITVGLVTLAQLTITYVPTMQSWFETRPVPLAEGALIVTIGLALFGIIELEKQLRLRFALKHRR